MTIQLNSLLLYVADPSASSDFYSKLGFKTTLKADSCLVAIGGFRITCFDETKAQFKQDTPIEPKGAGVFIHFEVNDVDDIYKSALEVGLSPSSEPRDWDWGNREFAIKDPDGYRLVFYQKL